MTLTSRQTNVFTKEELKRISRARDGAEDIWKKYASTWKKIQKIEKIVRK